MSIGFLLATVCSVGWSVADAMRKGLANQMQPLQLAVLLAGFQLLMGVCIAPILISFTELGGWSTIHIEAGYWPYALTTYAFTAAGHLYFFKALRASDLSLTIPFLSFSPVFVLGLGILLLNEWPATLALLGIVAITGGTFWLNRASKPKSSSVHTEDQAQSYKRGRFAMLVTAGCWSVAIVFDKAALAYTTPLTHLLGLLAATFILLSLFGRRDLATSVMAVTKTHGGRLLLVALLMMAALGLQLAAYAYWNIAYVEAIKRAIGLLSSLALGVLFFKETDPLRRLPAVLVLAIGSTLVILGS